MERVILPQAAASGNNFLYCTLWTIIDKTSRRMVGDICFKGAPNACGEVEIGYGIYSDFQNNGFMTEALGAICEWALMQPDVQAVLAETNKENTASHVTLLKNGFTITNEVANMIWWRTEKK